MRVQARTQARTHSRTHGWTDNARTKARELGERGGTTTRGRWRGGEGGRGGERCMQSCTTNNQNMSEKARRGERATHMHTHTRINRGTQTTRCERDRRGGGDTREGMREKRKRGRRGSCRATERSRMCPLSAHSRPCRWAAATPAATPHSVFLSAPPRTSPALSLTSQYSHIHGGTCARMHTHTHTHTTHKQTCTRDAATMERGEVGTRVRVHRRIHARANAHKGAAQAARGKKSRVGSQAHQELPQSLCCAGTLSLLPG